MTHRVLRLLAFVCLGSVPCQAQPRLTFQQQSGSLRIQVAGQPLATYVWEDREILRPYFAAVHAPNGSPVTRAHPPVAGRDATDHATMHPGIWLAFGDLGGADFWRNKARVQHVAFVELPRTTEHGGRFAVRNRYATSGKTICDEICALEIRVAADRYFIDWTSEFSGPADFWFGDQEEMGLGVRLATPLTVKHGGRIVNSDHRENEKHVWGQPAAWCDYSGPIDGRRVGIAIMPDPQNLRPSWFHARDYGLLVANPFGQQAFTKGARSQVWVRPGEMLRLRFGILVHSGNVDVPTVYRDWITRK